MTLLSPHFTYEELIHSQAASRAGLKNVPAALALANLKRLCKTLEQVRAIFGVAIIVSSGYRSPAVNKLVGGQPASRHMKGQAADINAFNKSPRQLMNAIIKADIEFDQLILEFNQWVHLSISADGVKPRKQALIIDTRGTRPY